MSLRERFWAKVDRNGPIHPVLGTRCWLWTAGRYPNGYGSVVLPREEGRQRRALAHRFAFEDGVGPIEDGLLVLHRCDIKPCVNYEDHLFLGTQAENLADCVAKGRHVSPVQEWKTRCPYGHEYTIANTYWKPGSRPGLWKRDCRTCRTRRNTVSNAARRAIRLTVGH